MSQIESLSGAILVNDSIGCKKDMKADPKAMDASVLAIQKEQEIAFKQVSSRNQQISTINEVFVNHQRTVDLLSSHNLLVWREQNNKLFYRPKPFAQKQKGTKEEISDIIFNIIGCHVNLYDCVDDVKVTNDHYLITSLLPMVRKDTLNPWTTSEFTHLDNNWYDRNTFEYTELLKRRFFPARTNQLEQELNYYREQLNYVQPNYQQILDQITNKEHELQWLKDSLVFKEESFIEELLKQIFYDVNEFYFLMSWLGNFFWNLNKSNIAVVLVGDSETTDILLEKIIKPIFICNKKYISTISNETISNESDDDKLLTDKIIYHINNLSSKTDIKRVSKLLGSIVKPNYITPTQAWDNDEAYIYGELLVTSEKENPYPYLKRIFSSCTVLRVKNMEYLLDRLGMDDSELDRNISSGLNNFVNKLVCHSQFNNPPVIFNTDEKSYL